MMQVLAAVGAAIVGGMLLIVGIMVFLDCDGRQTLTIFPWHCVPLPLVLCILGIVFVGGGAVAALMYWGRRRGSWE